MYQLQLEIITGHCIKMKLSAEKTMTKLTELAYSIPILCHPSVIFKDCIARPANMEQFYKIVQLT